MKLGGKRSTSNSDSAENRAEEVRQRRTQRSQQRVSSAARKITHPANPRPVLVRGHAAVGFPWEKPSQKKTGRKAPIVNTPIYSKASTRARRQFYLTMDQASGTELRLPALPSIHFGWRLLSGLIAIAILVGLYSVYQSPYFRIDTVDVQGLQRITPEEINSTLQLQNRSIIEANPQVIQQKLFTAYPELKDVQVSIELPNYISVTVSERIPVMAVQKGDKITWVDADGVLFDARGEAGQPLVTIHTEDALPLVSPTLSPNQMQTQDATLNQPASLIPDTSPLKSTPVATPGLKKIDPSLITAAEGLSQKLPADTKLVYSQKDGLGWTDEQGTQVYIGKDLGNFEAKYELYLEITKYLNDQGQKATEISVEHLSAPFYRLEQ